MLAAAMQTCSAALNSAATLVAYDLFKRYRRDISDHNWSASAKSQPSSEHDALPSSASPLFGHYTTIFQGINKLISYVAPPITTVFLLGVFWKRASGKSAFITLVAGMVLGGVTFCLDWNNIYRGDFMLTGVSPARGVRCHHDRDDIFFPEPFKAEAKSLVWENWRDPLRIEAGGRGIGDFRVVAAFILAVFIALYLIFR